MHAVLYFSNASKASDKMAQHNTLKAHVMLMMVMQGVYYSLAAP